MDDALLALLHPSVPDTCFVSGTEKDVRRLLKPQRVRNTTNIKSLVYREPLSVQQWLLLVMSVANSEKFVILLRQRAEQKSD